MQLQRDLGLDRVGVFLPGSWDERLGSHEKEEHDEGTDQVGVEHFVSHLGELKQPKEMKKKDQHRLLLAFQALLRDFPDLFSPHRYLPGVPLYLRTLSSMCVSLNTRVSGVMCSLCIRSLLRTSMACWIRLLISLEVDCHMLGSEPFVKEARIYSTRKEYEWCETDQVMFSV